MKYTYTSSFEGELVKYYESFFYHDKKDAIEETIGYIMTILEKYGCGKEMIADIGCGTGIYDQLLSEHFARVDALDISSDMIRFASDHHRVANVDYRVHNISTQIIPKQVDVAVALSHVIGYMIDNDSLRGFFSNISNSLKPGGILLFNFYNEPAIIRNELPPRTTRISEGSLEIIRESKATPILMENALAEVYKYHIVDGDIEIDIDINEKMRYFTVKELEEYINVCRMDILEVKNFLSVNDLSGDDWNGFMVCKKQ